MATSTPDTALSDNSHTTNSAAAEAGRSRLPPGQLRAYSFALVVCTMIAAADYAALNSLDRTGPLRRLAELAFCVMFVLQVIVLACATGKTLRQVPGRWLFFAWCLVLINLLLQPLQWSAPLKFAFLSAQFALLCIWCFLGASPWPWRVTTAVVLFPLLIARTFGNSVSGWTLIVLLQCVAVFAVSGVGWWLGYRIRRIEAVAGAVNQTGLQFRLRDIMVWMIAVGPAMLILKSMTWFEMLNFDWTEFGTAFVISVAFAATSILSLRATLGNLSPFRACVIVLVLPAIVGCALWLAFALPARLGGWNGNWRGFAYQPVTSLAFWIGSNWIPWMILFNSFLASLLLCFRADGQRLIRQSST